MSIDPIKHQDVFLKWTCGNEDAARLIQQFCVLARKVDDLVDEDIDKQSSIMDILELSLVHISSNRFYLQHMGAIQAVIFEMLIYW